MIEKSNKILIRQKIYTQILIVAKNLRLQKKRFIYHTKGCYFREFNNKVSEQELYLLERHYQQALRLVTNNKTQAWRREINFVTFLVFPRLLLFFKNIHFKHHYRRLVKAHRDITCMELQLEQLMMLVNKK